MMKPSLQMSARVCFMFSSSLIFFGCGSAENNDPLQTLSSKPSVQVQADDLLPLPNRRMGGEYTQATDLYGAGVIMEGNWFVDTKVGAWSASWYPISDDSLFKDPSSTLRKYDLYISKAKGTSTHAAEFEEKKIYQPSAESWAGRCHAWALASVMEPEPVLKRPVTLNDVTFGTADLKALLILTYDNVRKLTQFGQRFDGDENAIPEDIYPDQFHRVLQVELFGKKRPIIMDKDMGREVWNTPVHKAEITIVKDIENHHMMHVKAALVGSSPLDPSSKHEGPAKKNVIYEYTYDLYGYSQLDGSLKVMYGVWTGDSIRNHPDFLWALPDQKDRESGNPDINVQWVDELIKKATTLEVEHL
jgi:hypothetical protein